MTISLKHSYTAIGPGPGAGDGEVGVAEWNDDHVLTMASGKLLGRSTAGTGAAEEITVGTGLSLSGGTLTSSGGAAAGSAGEIQFNDGGAFGGVSGLAYSSNQLSHIGLFATDPDSSENVNALFNFHGVEIFSEADGSAYPNNLVRLDEYGLSINAYSGEGFLDGIGISGNIIYITSADVFGGDRIDIQVKGPNYADVSGVNSYTLPLPTSAGSSGQALTTDGSGVLSWADPAKSSAPASASATGRAGEIRCDSSYVYVCVAANTWKRAALSSW